MPNGNSKRKRHNNGEVGGEGEEDDKTTVLDQAQKRLRNLAREDGGAVDLTEID